MITPRIPSLRSIVQAETGQDIRRCQACLDCDANLCAEADIPLGSLIQLALLNDEETLTSRTLWSDAILEYARSACVKNLDLAEIIIALRREAVKRGIEGYIPEKGKNA
jgi:heterodisulfide reductase subunit C